MSKLSKHYLSIKSKNIISIQINLLNDCTSRCKYCRKYTWPKDMLEINKLKRTIYYLHTRSLASITFSGGDPILYPQLIEVLKYCEELGISTSIITTLITEDMSLLSDIAHHTTRIHVSIDGANKDLYLQTRGVDKFELVKRNVSFVNDIRRTLKKRPIRISSTISNINQKNLIELYDFAETTGSTINYYFIHRYDKYNPNDGIIHEELTCINEMDRDSRISNVNAILSNQFTNDYYSIKSKNCNIPYIHCLINANGDVYPCCKLLNDNGEYGEQRKYVYGNIYTDDLDDIFDKSKNKSKCIDTDCEGCEERYIPFIDEVNDIMDDSEEAAFL